MANMPASVVILGAGVTGLTTANTLLSRFPSSNLDITIVAKHLPGDTSQTEYCSPQAGANWFTFQTEFNKFAHYDKVTFERFIKIAEESPESGIKRFPLRVVSGHDVRTTENPWFEELVGGVKDVPKEELPEGAQQGMDLVTFMFNPNIYLHWLNARLIKAGVRILRRSYKHIDDVMSDFPHASAVFNCTGLGARTLGGVQDEKGQTLLIAEPITPLKRMAIWTQPSLFGPNEFAHVFPRPLGGGVIIGGMSIQDRWDETYDPSLAERTKQRACQLCPELGKPEDLQIIRHNVGLRPARTGGARIDVEERNGKVIVHSYGVGGAGYQSSWGMAEHAVDLLAQKLGRTAKL
ncbi:putative D-amino acid oxidase [Talaromyces proteolyticus]|uniref:D-amino acid oxidase n=1 Tax=Talaromyces proteolyticus TaxID=1131652 RepID=A0AAD4PZX8_9EURO|nr:putative D-amino acid oxidase [Talaromyces proteolyticus]KAH8703488.1 putative D-amino acid oxidase [Talaromyces proteolyticus]